MKKLFLLLACVVMSMLAMGQDNQLVWANGRLLYGTPIESIDSLTYDEMEDIDTLHLLLPRTLIKVVHDTVYIHDTVYVETDCGGEGDTPSAGIGVFSVGEGKTVTFSPGNLFFNATKGSHLRADGTTATGTWYFAENQWDYFGNSGLFGWGTSGYDNTKNDPMAVFYQPWNISYKSLTEVRKDSTLNCDSYEITGECEWDYTYFTSSEQNKNKYGYGPSLGMSDVNLVGSSAYYDWGMYNAISNGGDKTGSWRLLTEAEWDYLLNTRKNAQFLRSQATVNDVYGYVLLPDDFKKPSDITWSHQTNNWATNTYTVEQWRVLEAVGAIFLPAANYRRGTGQVLAKGGHYWSATVSGADRACYFYFNTENTGTSMYGERCDGRSVRLVKDVE